MAFFTGKQQREVFHLLFLERLLSISDAKFYAVKGGVNLRFFFNSPRYSEDMDIDVYGVAVDTLKKNGYKILGDSSFKRLLQSYGIENLLLNDPAKAKQTQTTQRFRLRLVTVNQEELPTQVDFSRRRKFDSNQVTKELILPEVVRPYKRLSFTCLHYRAEYAVVQKVEALGGRSETQARDVFDLHLLYRAGHLRLEDLRKRTTKVQRERALAALLSLDYAAFRSQVVEYLEVAQQAELGSKQAWDQMCDLLVEMLNDGK